MYVILVFVALQIDVVHVVADVDDFVSVRVTGALPADIVTTVI